MIRKVMCGLCIAIMLLSVTSCNAKQKAEVELFNQNTEATINLYSATVEKAEGKEIEIITGILNANLSEDYISDYDYSAHTELLQANKAEDFISAEPLVSLSRFYTSLGANSVTQVITFNIQGTSYLMQALWTDAKISYIALEVL